MLDRRSFLRTLAGAAVVSLCPLPIVKAAEMMAKPLAAAVPVDSVALLSKLLRESLAPAILDLEGPDPIFAMITEREWRVA